MKCQTHPDQEAVGVCIVCKQGLCKSCDVVKNGTHYCRRHAAIALTKREPAAPVRNRGIALALATILCFTNGLAGVVVGFLLMLVGLLTPSSETSSLFTPPFQGFLSYFSAVTKYSPAENILVGFLAFIGGTLTLIAGYFLWRRSKRGAILSVALAIFGEVLIVVYRQVPALAGAFTYVWAVTTATLVVLIALGWRHLGPTPQTSPSAAKLPSV